MGVPERSLLTADVFPVVAGYPERSFGRNLRYILYTLWSRKGLS